MQGLFFPAGDDHAHFVTVPIYDKTLNIEYWLVEPNQLNHIFGNADVSLAGIRRRNFDNIPFSSAPALPHTYSIYYYAQNVHLPVNPILETQSTAAAQHLLLRGDALVVKQRSSAVYEYEDMTSEDINLVLAIIRRYVNVNRYSFTNISPSVQLLKEFWITESMIMVCLRA